MLGHTGSCCFAVCIVVEYSTTDRAGHKAEVPDTAAVDEVIEAEVLGVVNDVIALTATDWLKDLRRGRAGVTMTSG
jgi:hypothetical protein